MLRYVRSSFQQDFVIIITLSAIVISRVVPSFHPSQRKEFCLSRMGIVFGKTGVEEPAFRVIARAPTYEVRVLPAHVKASVAERLSGNGNSGAFPVLAAYIGVTRAAQNNENQAIAMTAPVLQTPTAARVDADSGALLHSGYADGSMELAFMLPAQYTSVESCPTPKDPRVLLTEHAPKLVAVSTPPFSGSVDDSKVQARADALLNELRADGLYSGASESKNSAAGATDSQPKNVPEWHVAQYHPPFTLPWFRRNEIWWHLKDVSEDQARAVLARHSSTDAPAS